MSITPHFGYDVSSAEIMVQLDRLAFNAVGSKQCYLEATTSTMDVGTLVIDIQVDSGLRCHMS